MINLKNISAGYGNKRILNNINVNFKKGEITTIIGPNGSGKSTLLKSIISLCDIYEGSVYLNGKTRKEIGSKEFAKSISYLAQSHSLPSISVERMVLHGRFPYLNYPRSYKKEDISYCNEAMKKTGVYELRHKNVQNLSGGERQKVYLAMALAGKSEIFLFDEPTTYLDIEYQLELLKLMTELRNDGKTVISVLHDLDYALRISDNIIVVNEGTIECIGSPSEIYEKKIIDTVFHIKSKRFITSEGNAHYYFY